MFAGHIASVVAVLALLASGVQVDVYDGPKTCDDSEKVKKNQHLSIHYTGTIDNTSEAGVRGSQFFSTRSSGNTFSFQVGIGSVLKGWDEGLLGLCKGAKATLVIPPEEGYGEEGPGEDIPGGATLHFDVEVVDISDEAPPPENLFAKIDTDNDNRLTKEEVLAHFKQQDRSATELPGGFWDAEDKDKDGFISWDEFGGPKGISHKDSPPENLFAKIDTDKDNKLSEEELLAFFMIGNPEVTELPPDLMDNEDKDKDGFISWDEFEGPKGEPEAEETVEKQDKEEL